jgi:hypothetical protein
MEYSDRMDAFDGAKIADPELRTFAASQDADERRTVIVELGVAPPPVAIAFDRRLGMGRPAPQPRRQEGDRRDLADVEGHGELMNELEGRLRSLGLSGKVVRLDAAQAFVISVTAAQLCALSRLPLAGIIRPNRSHFAAQRR